MAAGVVTNFLVRAQTPSYFPLFFKHSPSQEEEQMQEDKPEAQDEEEEKEVDEDEEEDEESEAQEEEEEGLEEVFLDVTKQLLRFADLISHDVQRYFGRCSSDQEACNIYSDSVTVTGSGRLRYYDDLLKIARAESPEEQENCFVTCADDQEVRHPKNNSGLGPLAELFDQRGQSQGRGRGRPMIKRHLPLSFWTEPIPCCSLLVGFNTSDVAQANSENLLQDSTHTDAITQIHYNLLPHHNTHTLDSAQPDFSDLLANWDPNPELTHTLTESTHMQR